jgi:hypothetical protein
MISSLFINDFAILARQVLVQSSSNSRARSKEWWIRPCLMFQTLSLCVCCSLHISLKYDNICLPHSWYPQCYSPCFYVPKTHRWMIAPLNQSGRLVLADAWLISLAGFIQCCNVTKSVFPFPRIFVGATNLMLLQTQFYYVYIRS